VNHTPAALRFLCEFCGCKLCLVACTHEWVPDEKRPQNHYCGDGEPEERTFGLHHVCTATVTVGGSDGGEGCTFSDDLSPKRCSRNSTVEDLFVVVLVLASRFSGSRSSGTFGRRLEANRICAKRFDDHFAADLFLMICDDAGDAGPNSARFGDVGSF
jgi:hypothetical protein